MGKKTFPANIYLFQVNTYSEPTIETLEKGVKYVQSQWHSSGVLIVNHATLLRVSLLHGCFSLF